MNLPPNQRFWFLADFVLKNHVDFTLKSYPEKVNYNKNQHKLGNDIVTSFPLDPSDASHERLRSHKFRISDHILQENNNFL